MAQRIKDEEIRIKVSVDASSGTKELNDFLKASVRNSKSIAELTKRAKELKNRIAHLDPGTKEFKILNKELLLVNARLQELRSGSVKTSGIFSRLRTGKCRPGHYPRKERDRIYKCLSRFCPGFYYNFRLTY